MNSNVFLKEVFLNQMAAKLLDEVRNFIISPAEAKKVAQKLKDIFKNTTSDKEFIEVLSNTNEKDLPEISDIKKLYLTQYG